MRLALAFMLTGCVRQPVYPGQVERLDLFSDVVGDSYAIDVFPPATPGAGDEPVYVVGGDGLAEAVAAVAWARGWPVVVIGVGYPDGLPLQRRLRDLTSVDEPESPLPSGGADAFTAFLRTELVPELERTPALTARRWLLGHGLGGLYGVHVALTQPVDDPLFNAVVAASPDLYRDGASAQADLDVRALDGGLPLSMLLSYGELEDVQVAGTTRALAEGLAQAEFEGLALRQIAIDDAVHEATALPTYEEGLSWLLDAP